MESREAQERILTFSLGRERYGLPLECVESIEPCSTLTPLPNMPPFLAGILSVRGQVIPVMSLRLRLGIEPPREQAEADRFVIITQQESRRLGLMVDAVHGVVPISAGWVESDIALITGRKGSEYLAGVLNLAEDGFVILLNLGNLLNQQERDNLTEFTS
jgi:purine-binding chemotaxis protein CheW